jgi:hypothetical protein
MHGLDSKRLAGFSRPACREPAFREYERRASVSARAMRHAISKAPLRPPRIVRIRPRWHPLSWSLWAKPWTALRRALFGRG